MNGNREINVKARIDSSNVAQDARTGAQAIARELGKVVDQAKQIANKLWGELKNDRGAFASLKTQVDKFTADLAAGVGKINFPTEKIAAASRATAKELDRLGEENFKKLAQLEGYLENLNGKMQQAMKIGNAQAYSQAQSQAQLVQQQIIQRERLGKEIQNQYTALERLVGEEVLEGKSNQIAIQGQQSLSRQLAATKKRMEELTQAGNTNTQEYESLKAKAKELAQQIKQLNQDSTPEVQVRFRTALMNVKNEMMQLKKEGKENTEQYRLLREEAVRLQQAMNGTSKQIKNMANPNATFQGMINGLSGMSGMFSVATGAMSLFGEENEELQKSMMKLQSIMSITMGLQSISTALNQNSAFQLNILGRLTNWWAACKAKAAGAITTETAAIGANTAAVGKGVVANTAYAFSWKAVGVALKSIPIAGWIAAVVALAASIYNLHKGYNYAKEAKKELHKAQLNANKSAAEELATVKALYAATQNHSLSIEKRRAAANKMQDLYPSVFKNLKTEAILAGNAADAYKDLTQAIINKSKAEARRERLKDIEKSRLENEEKFRQEAAEWVARYNRAAVGSFGEAESVQSIIDNGGLRASFGTEGNPDLFLAESTLNTLINRYLKPNRERAKEQERLIRELGVLEATPEAEQRAATEGDPLYYKRLMEQAQNRADNHLYTEAQRRQAQKDYYKYKRMYENSRFDPKDYTTALGNADAAEQKAEDEVINARRARAKALLKIDQELEQRRIDIMEDGAEKRIRQRKLDSQKEMDGLFDSMEQEVAAEIARQKQIWNAQEEANARAASAQGRQYRKKTFSAGDITSTTLTPGQLLGSGQGRLSVDAGNVDTAQINLIVSKYGLLQDLLLRQQQRRIGLEQKAERQAMDQYLIEYGSLQEKREATDRLYAEKLRNASTQAEAMRVQQQWNEALNKIEFDDFVRNRAALAFGEVENLSAETLASLITDMEKYRSKVLATFNPENISKFEEALTRLKKAQTLNSQNPFSTFIPEYFREKAAALAELNEKERLSNELSERKAELEREEADRMANLISLIKTLTGIKVAKDQVKDGTTISRIVEDLTAQGNTVSANLIQTANSGLGKTTTELQQVTQAFQDATQSFNLMASMFGAKYTGFANNLKAVEAVVKAINANVQSAAALMHDLSNTAGALGADTEVGSGWDKATTMMDAFAEASQGATNAFESLKSGNVMGVVQGVAQSFTAWIRGFAAIHDASRERTIQRLQEQVEDLDRINKRIDRKAGKQYSKEAADSYEEMAANTQRQIALIQRQIAAERDKKNTDGDRIQEWEDQIEELQNQVEDYKDAALDAIVGEDISTSIGNFADALVDAWGSSRQAAKSAKDFVKDMLRQMVIEAMKTDLTEPMKRLREMMAGAMTDGEVTAAERKAMEDFTKKLAEDLQHRYDWAEDILNTSAKSQNGGDTGTFATANQDSVNELNGRFAALHTSFELARETLAGLKIDTAGIREAIANQTRLAQESHDLQVNAIGHLEAISKNTKQLYEMNERLGKIEKNTEGL